LWAAAVLFRNDTVIQDGFCSLKRYQNTKFTAGFKSLLTLLELAGANLHDEKTGGGGALKRGLT
jgi:hypothetical protein